MAKSRKTKQHGIFYNASRWPLRYWHRSRWHKALILLLLLVGLWVGTMYTIAQWYIASQASKPLNLGVTFISDYARHYDLDPEKTMDAMINDLGVKRFRLVSYWDKIEPQPGVYNFSDLDWQFRKAEAANAKVSLAIGLRQPRWPECHEPKWVDISQPQDQWLPQLKTYMQKVIERYKGSPALESYQLENEYFLKVFGLCKNFSRARLVNEYNFVKRLDSQHPVVVARSNNAIGIPLYAPTPDMYGVSVYKRVWDKTLTKRYIEYPFPAWFYGFLAGMQKIYQGRDMIIHELQAEPWVPEKFNGTLNTPLVEQDKSMNAQRLKDRFEYGEATGMRTIDLWGAEWWYWRKEKHNDPSLWNVAKEAFHEANKTHQR